MKTLRFTITIDAKPQEVWDTMLMQETYRMWTAEFTEGSYYEGSWNHGERIRFLGPDGSGMVAVIAENRPHELLSIKHLGEIKDGIEDTESAQVKTWAPAFENYSFSASGAGTKIAVSMEVVADYEDFMAEVWPKALAKLKKICEKNTP